MSDVHYKVWFYGAQGGLKEVRRACHPHSTIADFPDVTAKVFGLLGHEGLRLEYEDADGDRVVLESQEEWEECLRAGSYTTAHPLRLHATKRKAGNEMDWESPKRSRKCKERFECPSAEPPAEPCPPSPTSTPSSSPNPPEGVAAGPRPAGQPATPLASALQSTMKEVRDTVRRYIKVTHTEAVPPAWLAGAVNVARPWTEDREVERDVNLTSFAAALSMQALSLMSAHKYTEALALLLESQAVRPRKETMYNVACCLALQGQAAEAMEALETAVQMGYTDRDHLLQDPDLASLWGNPLFEALVAWLHDSGIAAASASSTSHPGGEQESAAPTDVPPAAPAEPVAAEATQAEAPRERGGGHGSDGGWGGHRGRRGFGRRHWGGHHHWRGRGWRGGGAPAPTRMEFVPLEPGQLPEERQEALFKLHELGFTSDDANLRALEATGWSVRHAIDQLLGTPAL